MQRHTLEEILSEFQFTRENHVIETKLKVLGAVAGFHGLFDELAVSVGTKLATRGHRLGRHAASLVRQLRFTGMSEELRILVGANLPFETMVQVVVHDLTFATNHGAVSVLAQHANGSAQVFRRSRCRHGHEATGGLDGNVVVFGKDDANLGLLFRVRNQYDFVLIISTEGKGQVSKGVLLSIERELVGAEFKRIRANTHSRTLDVREGIHDRRTDMDVEAVTIRKLVGMEEDKVALSVERVTFHLTPAKEMGVTMAIARLVDGDVELEISCLSIESEDCNGIIRWNWVTQIVNIRRHFCC